MRPIRTSREEAKRQTLTETNLLALSDRLLLPPKKAYPFKFEFEIRYRLSAFLKEEKPLEEKCLLILDYLSDIRFNETYAYRRGIATQYYNYFKKMMPSPEYLRAEIAPMRSQDKIYRWCCSNGAWKCYIQWLNRDRNADKQRTQEQVSLPFV